MITIGSPDPIAISKILFGFRGAISDDNDGDDDDDVDVDDDDDDDDDGDDDYDDYDDDDDDEVLEKSSGVWWCIFINATVRLCP